MNIPSSQSLFIETGGLLRIGIKLMMLSSNSEVWVILALPGRQSILLLSQIPSFSAETVPLVNLIAIAFQIRDDHMNLQSSEFVLNSSQTSDQSINWLNVRFCLPCQDSNNKGCYEDLTEGKFSFPVVHSIRADESNRQVISK
jgi:geranylgeranyl diphosphate synthase, type III